MKLDLSERKGLSYSFLRHWKSVRKSSVSTQKGLARGTARKQEGGRGGFIPVISPLDPIFPVNMWHILKCQRSFQYPLDRESGSFRCSSFPLR